jgi:hypothetical protein
MSWMVQNAVKRLKELGMYRPVKVDVGEDGKGKRERPWITEVRTAKLGRYRGEEEGMGRFEEVEEEEGDVEVERGEGSGSGQEEFERD